MTRRNARVLLVDDHAILRRGIRSLLEASHGVDIVGEASSGSEAIERARSLKPDIVIMDVAMSGMDGLKATRHILELELGIRVLVLTVHEEEEFVAGAIEAGASGFLSKRVADTMLEPAIAALMRGYSYLPGNAPSPSATGLEGDQWGDRPLLLTDQERRVVKLTAAGHSARDVAATMQLSPKTVEGYLRRAKRKLGLATRSDIVSFALETGLLKPPNASEDAK